MNTKMNYLTRIFILILFSTVLFPGCGKKEAEKEVIRPVRAVQVGGAAILTENRYPGKAKGTQEVNLSFRLSGPLIERPVNVGDEVKKGQLLARIDPRDYEVALKNARGKLERAKATLNRAQSDYDRVVRARKSDPGAISESMIDQRLGERDQARAQVKSLSAEVAGAKDNLSYTYLRAPFNGTIVETFVENFETVQAKQDIVRLVDTSRIEFVINIPENLISYVDYVHRGFVRFDAFPDRVFSAGIKEIGKEASRTTRTYPLTLIMDQQEDFKILPGMAGQAWGDKESMDEIIKKGFEKRGEGFEVPVSAVFTPDTEMQSYVWLIDEQTKTLKRRAVTTGKLTKSGIRVTEGLETGEWIVTAGVHSVKEGQKVRILTERGE